MIPKVFKRIQPEDISINGVPVSKKNRIINPSVSKGIYTNNLTPIGTLEAENDLINESGVYQSVHWHSVKHQYYKIPKHYPLDRNFGTNYVFEDYVSYDYID